MEGKAARIARYAVLAVFLCLGLAGLLDGFGGPLHPGVLAMQALLWGAALLGGVLALRRHRAGTA